MYNWISDSNSSKNIIDFFDIRSKFTEPTHLLLELHVTLLKSSHSQQWFSLGWVCFKSKG